MYSYLQFMLRHKCIIIHDKDTRLLKKSYQNSIFLFGIQLHYLSRVSFKWEKKQFDVS